MRKSMMRTLPFLAVLAGGLAAGGAVAAPVTYGLTLTSTSGGVNGTGSLTVDAPTTPVSGTFTPIDLSLSIGGFALTLASGAGGEFASFTAGVLTSLSYLGSSTDTNGTISVSGTDFSFFNTADNSQSLGTVTAVPVTAAVPEPASLVLLAASAVGIGLARRRKAA